MSIHVDGTEIQDGHTFGGPAVFRHVVEGGVVRTFLVEPQDENLLDAICEGVRAAMRHARWAADTHNVPVKIYRDWPTETKLVATIRPRIAPPR